MNANRKYLAVVLALFLCSSCANQRSGFKSAIESRFDTIARRGELNTNPLEGLELGSDVESIICRGVSDSIESVVLVYADGGMRSLLWDGKEFFEFGQARLPDSISVEESVASEAQRIVNESRNFVILVSKRFAKGQPKISVP